MKPGSRKGSAVPVPLIAPVTHVNDLMIGYERGKEGMIMTTRNRTVIICDTDIL